MVMIEYFLEMKNHKSIFKICEHVFITNARVSKLLKMYDFDYLDHTQLCQLLCLRKGMC